MKVSIVTISYNQAKFVEAAIQSVIEQDYRDIEYIVVDAGSTDGSRDIISRYRDRIAKIILEPDNGPAEGLNKGFKHATGDIFGFVNADDKLLPGAVTSIVRAYGENPDADIVQGNGYIIDGEDRILRKVYTDRFHLRQFGHGCVTFVQPSVFVRRSSFEQVGGFNAENRTCWDGELLVDLALNGAAFVVIEEFLSSFRLHPSSISGTQRASERYRIDRNRIHFKIFGKAADWRDIPRKALARLTKWVRNPRGLRASISSRIVSMFQR